jgi:hypothetical protein
MFSPKLKAAIDKLEKPNEGEIVSTVAMPQAGLPVTFGTGHNYLPKPCGAGIGTRGGKSRGIGSGSRLRKYVCDCGQIIRAACDDLDATHNECKSAFICQ